MTTFLKSLRPCHALLTSRHVSAAPSVNKLAAIKELRESSGAPISDVKAALDEAKYDLGEPSTLALPRYRAVVIIHDLPDSSSFMAHEIAQYTLSGCTRTI